MKSSTKLVLNDVSKMVQSLSVQVTRMRLVEPRIIEDIVREAEVSQIYNGEVIA